MNIDITSLLNNRVTTIHVKDTINIPKTFLENSRIDELKDVSIEGKITFNEDNDLVLSANMNGIMVLKDDLTLAPTEVNFDAEVEEILPKNQNILDITDILWQNILVEVPSKVRSTDEETYPSGDGWRVISEDEYEKERTKSNNPFANLNELIKTKEDK